MNATLTVLFNRLRSEGFTARQARAYWDEVHVLASPILFSLSALRASPRMRAVAAAHSILSNTVLEVQTVQQWLDYCEQMPVHMNHVQEAVCRRWSTCNGALRNFWPVLAMDEGLREYTRRTTMGHPMPSERLDINSWEELLESVEHRYALDVLCEQVLTPKYGRSRSWQRVLSMTGLRSVRWSFGDEPGDARHQARLMEVLLHAQRLLRAGVGWNGPVLGLAGRTSIALTDRGKSDGMVQPDPGGNGQTMTLGHWSVLAHEWMHAVDITLAHHFHCKQSWATHAALAWDDDEPPPEALMVWFWQAGRILGATPPDYLLPSIRAEVDQWEDRVTASLGISLEVQEEIVRQRIRLSKGTWSQADAEEGWCRVSRSAGAIGLMRRTAHLLSRDLEFVVSVRLGHSLGHWSEYIGQLRPLSLSMPPILAPGAGEIEEHAFNLHSQQQESLRYLTNSVEVMARSFESSLAHGRARDVVWLPSSSRPNAGLIWPTAAEAAFHSKSWRATLKALRPLWREWKSGHATSKRPPPGVEPGDEDSDRTSLADGL